MPSPPTPRAFATRITALAAARGLSPADLLIACGEILTATVLLLPLAARRHVAEQWCEMFLNTVNDGSETDDEPRTRH